MTAIGIVSSVILSIALLYVHALLHHLRLLTSFLSSPLLTLRYAYIAVFSPVA